MRAKAKIAALRELMKDRGLAAYYVPSTDPHQSEYVPACWQRRAWLTGFTGSAGDVLVTRSHAGLWTDGRYFLHAEKELRGSGIKLYRMGMPGVPSIRQYVERNLKEGDTLGVDPRVVSVKGAGVLEEALGKAGARLRAVDENLVDGIWKDRPQMPPDPIRILPNRFAGETSAAKLRRLRKAMKERRADAHVITTLDAIAWLYNVRGRDVDFNPVAISYALVTADEAILFINPEKVSLRVMKKLGSKVHVRPYEDFPGALSELAMKRATVWIDESSASRWVADLLEGSQVVTEPTPVLAMKARKNATEIEGMRAAHVRDGVAMVRFLHWLEGAVKKGRVTEMSAADRLEEIRSEGEHFQGLSFRTISGYGGHGAIIHYSVSPESDMPLKPEGIYLVDSGGQYLDGTTDITRTVLLGKKATKEQKDRFTRVLKGHIALARARFPEGVHGIRLDTLARLPLWEAGLDYNHGTGHGVGAHLCVHEGPQSISIKGTDAALEPGNILSNEPGYYEPGAYGFRIESCVLVAPEGGLSRNGTRFNRFETLTMCPIDTRLIDVKLLTSEERAWLNDYHKTVHRTLSKRLGGAGERAWLKKACASI